MNKPAVRFRPVAPFYNEIYIIYNLIYRLRNMAKQISELAWEKKLLIISYKNQNNQIFAKAKKFISDNKIKTTFTN